MLPYFGARPCCSTLSFRGDTPLSQAPRPETFPLSTFALLPGAAPSHDWKRAASVSSVDPRSDWLVQAKTISPATSKLYTRAVLPPAILACSSSGTPARISARIFRDWGKVDSLCG